MSFSLGNQDLDMFQVLVYRVFQGFGLYKTEKNQVSLCLQEWLKTGKLC